MTRRTIITSSCILVVLAVAVGLYLQHVAVQRRLYGPGGGYRCGTHLKQVGLAILLYQLEHEGRYPATLGDLVAGADISPDVLTCPFAPDRGANAFVFVAAGRIAREVGDDEIVAHELLGNHEGDGAMALFGDGHIRWMTPSELRDQLALHPTTRATPSTAPAETAG